MRYYIAGPMTGIAGFNVPAFDRLAAILREEGHDVVSPVELDGAESRAIIMASETGSHADLPPGETWGFYLSRDVKLLADDGIQGVVCLPGWETSSGARLETFTAKALLGLPVYGWYGRGVGMVALNATALVRAWAGGLWDDVVLPGRGR